MSVFTLADSQVATQTGIPSCENVFLGWMPPCFVRHTGTPRGFSSGHIDDSSQQSQSHQDLQKVCDQLLGSWLPHRMKRADTASTNAPFLKANAVFMSGIASMQPLRVRCYEFFQRLEVLSSASLTWGDREQRVN